MAAVMGIQAPAAKPDAGEATSPQAGPIKLQIEVTASFGTK